MQYGAMKGRIVQPLSTRVLCLVANASRCLVLMSTAVVVLLCLVTLITTSSLVLVEDFQTLMRMGLLIVCSPMGL